MPTPKGDQRKSRVEFDNVYFKVYEDAVRLCENNFGANEDMRIAYKEYISANKTEIMQDVLAIGRYIRMANSIYPKSKEDTTEIEARRLYQSQAIGLCYDILTKYELLMKMFKVKDDKYTLETKNLSHEINCLKNWRKSDNKRFS